MEAIKRQKKTELNRWKNLPERKRRAIWYLCKQNKINLIYFWTNDHRNKYELINQRLLFIVNSTPKLEWRFLSGVTFSMRIMFVDVRRHSSWCCDEWLMPFPTDSMNSVPSTASTMYRLFIWFHILIALVTTSLLPPL